MLSFVREGDVLIVHTLDRLARTLLDLLTMVQDGRGVSVRFITEKLDFDVGRKELQNPHGENSCCPIVGAFSEFEMFDD